ncbi:hypothetical protein [Mycobacterium sp. E3198]|uniref:hypothetical protein n=1 Tax=Mycobacterium sp. E3198 TaxID=1834143 RepID=UPI0018D400DE|nr:hypothetical protein [Mycobacterium sp. E3198]
MAAVAGIPSLSQLVVWPTEHLTEAAEHWDAVAGRSYAVANQVWRDALSVDWHGEGAEALRTATHADMMTTGAVADQLQAAAEVARSGASDLVAARSRLRYAIQDANAAGFDMYEDMSVVDRSTGGPVAERAARQAKAQTFAADIRQRAAQLVALDQQVAGRVTTAMAGIREACPRKTDLQAVDNHTFKQDPPPGPPGPPGDPFAGWTDEQKQQVAIEIAHGHALDKHAEDFPKGWTERDLARWIYESMNDPKTRFGSDIDSGALTLLRDGKIIQINPRGRDYGTTYAPQPRPGSTWRTPQDYFEQRTRPVEPLPPPAPGRLPPVAPGEMAPPGPAAQPPRAPQTGPPPPKEAMPAPKPAPPVQGGKGPAVVGGPAATPFGPTLVPPPHAGHHHPPVLGDMDPNPWDHGE